MTVISTWNVNGIRSIYRKGFTDYLNQYSPDILCLQEVKAKKTDIQKLIDELSPSYDFYLSEANRPGYSGTAILIKKKYWKDNFIVKEKLGIDKFDHEGRCTILETPSFFLINGYFPNGQRDHGRVDFKLEFSFAILDHALELSKTRPVIITGDFNTAHCEIDLKNPKSNINTTGFLPIEREYIDQLIEQRFIDIFRHTHPNQKDAYTWWTYRQNCRANNIGWRLDYFFIFDELLKNVKSVDIKKEVLGSDHCPVHLTLTI